MLKRFVNFKKWKKAEERRKLCMLLEAYDIDLFVDVGANVGQTGLGLRQGGYSGRIISLEPVMSSYEKLLAASADDPLWDAHRWAAGETEETTEISVSESSDLSSLSGATEGLISSLPKVREVAREIINVVRLDRLLPEHLAGARRLFLKIDTQGHDLPALRGAEGIMGRLQGIQIEMSLLPLYKGEPSYLEILNYLDERGFRPHFLFERGFSQPLKRQLQIDGVFVREAE